METWESGLKVRYARAAQRELLYAAAVDALKRVERDDWLTWSGLADMLNGRGVTNHLGRLWSGPMVSSFVRQHEAVTGERLVGWMGTAGLRLAKERMRHEARDEKERQRKARGERARMIAKLCANAKTYKEGVRILDAGGVSCRTGGWTIVRLGDFVRRYERDYGVKLMPLVEMKPGLVRGPGKRVSK